MLSVLFKILHRLVLIEKFKASCIYAGSFSGFRNIIDALNLPQKLIINI